MKKQLLTFSIAVLSLVFLAAMAHAYTAPVSAPGAGNTDGPLTIGAVNQVKEGGLAVGTFQAQKDAYFDQTTLFNGVLQGGTPTASTVPIAFGGAANRVDVSFNGAVSINGVYQSDTLKTGGGQKPICADKDGIIFLCGTTPVAAPVTAAPTVYGSPDSISVTITNPVCQGHTDPVTGGCGQNVAKNASFTIPLANNGSPAKLSSAVSAAVYGTYSSIPSKPNTVTSNGYNGPYINAIASVTPAVFNQHPLLYQKYVSVTSDIENKSACFTLTDPITNSAYVLTSPLTLQYALGGTRTNIGSQYGANHNFTMPAGQSTACDTANTYGADFSIGTSFITYSTNIKSVSPATTPDNRIILY